MNRFQVKERQKQATAGSFFKKTKITINTFAQNMRFSLLCCYFNQYEKQQKKKKLKIKIEKKKKYRK